MRAAWLVCVVAAIVAPRDVRADEPAPPPPAEPAPPSEPSEPEPPVEKPSIDTPILRPTRVREIIVDVPGERSLNNKLALAATAVAGVLAGGVGLYYHLDSRSASDVVSASMPTGAAWSAADQAQVDRADRSKTRAAIGYTIGGLFLTGAIVGLIVTEPKTERAVIHPQPSVAIGNGGAVVGGTWRF